MKELRADPLAGESPDAAGAASGSPGKRSQVDQLVAEPGRGTSPLQPGAHGRPVLQSKRSAGEAGSPASETSKPSHHLTEIARTAIDELDGDQSKKVLLSTVLAAARRGELPAFTALLKAAPDATYGDHFI